MAPTMSSTRHARPLDLRGVRDRGVQPGQPDHRREEGVERVGHGGPGAHLGHEADVTRRLLHQHDPSGRPRRVQLASLSITVTTGRTVRRPACPGRLVPPGR